MKIILFFLLFFCHFLLCRGNPLPDPEKADASTDSLVNVLNSKARVAFMKGDFDESREFLEKVLDIKIKYYSNLKRNLANTYLNISVAYVYAWDFDKAITMSLKANELYVQSDSTNINVGKTLFYISVLYRNIGDYVKSEQYFQYSLNFYLKYNHDIDQGLFQYTQGALYYLLKEYYKSNTTWLEYTKIATEKYTVYNGIALNYIALGEIDEAERYYRMIFQLPDLVESEMHQVYLNYGIFLYEQRHDKESAFHYFDLALKSALKHHSYNNTLLSQIYHNYGEVYLKENEITTALQYFQKALIAGSTDFTETDYLSNPSPENIYNLSRIYITLKFKARVLRAYYVKYNDIRFLKSSLEVSGICFDIINKMRYRISSEGSLFSISENEKDVYTEAVSTAYLLFELTGDMKYFNNAFQINEMSKAFVLLSHLRTQKAMMYGNIPAELTDKEKELHRKLSLYEEQVLLEKQKKVQDEQRLKTWEELLAKYNVEYDILLRRFEEDYPDYYDLKYRTDYISPEEINVLLRKNDAVLAYSISDRYLFTFIITSEKTGFFRHEVSSNLEQDCNDYYRLITTQNFSKNVDATFTQMTNQGYRLYNMLLEPFEDITRGKNLIIIADGEIAYLPFDALLTEEIQDTHADYRNLPYLLYKHSTGFSYSATLHFRHDLKSRAQNKSVLAFAPTYGNLMVNLQEENLLRKEDRHNLIILPGIKDEVKNISKYLNTEIYLDYKATEGSFKRHASDYEILHLAMHTILDDKNPLYSKMAFTQLVEEEEDGFLHAFEIYNMQLNARLAVLSSCSSGFGKLQEGEGMQSLARSFSYAGCPSILMSLWEVADYATVEMMDYFYKYLIQGFSKPEALRLSKLDFITKADGLKSNPFFWSGFIILGDSEPLFNSFNYSKLRIFLIPLLFVSLVVLVIFLRKQYFKNRKNNFTWYTE